MSFGVESIQIVPSKMGSQLDKRQVSKPSLDARQQSQLDALSLVPIQVVQSPRSLNVELILKTWPHNDQEASLLLGQNGLFARIQQKDLSVVEVPVQDINGIPKDLSNDPRKLQAFLQDTYIKLNRLSDGSHKLYINPRLRGGGLEPSSQSSGITPYLYTLFAVALLTLIIAKCSSRRSTPQINAVTQERNNWFDWEISYTQNHVNSTPEKIWQLWTDVSNWPKWDKSLTWSRLDGPFEVGSKGTLKPKSGPSSPFDLTEVIPNRRFTNQSSLPGAVMTFTHDIRETDFGVDIIHRVRIQGKSTPLFSKVIGNELKKDLPKAVRGLAEFAERI